MRLILTKTPKEQSSRSLAPDPPPSNPLLRVLLPLFDDPAVDEVLVNGARSLTVVSAGGSRAQASPFDAAFDLHGWLQELAFERHVRLDPLCPAAGGSYDGHRFRWHALMPPLSPEGPLFSLRRHRFESLTLDHFATSDDTAQSLRALVAARANLLIAGPTGSGKTTLLAALLGELALDERVIAVESLQELPLTGPSWIRLLERRSSIEGSGGIGLPRLVQEALRLRPDRLVIGEIRGDEAGAFVEAGLTGHGGLMATIHADSKMQALARLRLLGRLGSRSFEQSLRELAPTLGVVVLARGQPPRVVSLTAPDGLANSALRQNDTAML